VLLGFIDGGVFTAVVGDLCHNGVMSVGFWVVSACFLAVLVRTFLVPVMVPLSVVILGLKYVSIVAVVGESAAFGFIIVSAAAMVG